MKLLYVLVVSLFATTGCTMDAAIRFVADKPLYMEMDQSNSAVNSANLRAYSFKGHCSTTGSTIEAQVGSQSKVIPCAADGTFTATYDLQGVVDGTQLTLIVQQTSLDKKLLTDQKTVTVDLTPPTLTFEVPDNSTNYPLSSLKSHYPLTGACSEPFNIVNITSSTQLNYTAVCSALSRWTIYLNLSAETATSIEFYAKHFDTAGNVSATVPQVIQSAQWQKISPPISATGVSSFREIIPFGDTGRIIVAVPLRNDDLVDLGIVNYDGTGLTRISPSFGSWGLDSTKPLTAVPKYNRALYMTSTMGRAQLRELHSVAIDGTDDKILMGASAANPVGGPTTYTLTPDQETVVALGDLEVTDNEFHIYTIKVVTGEIRKISGSMVPGGDVRDFILSPDGSEVIFRADKDTDEGVDLYAVKLDGSNLRKISTSMSVGKTVQTGYKVSPDGKWVFYRDNNSVATGNDLSITSMTNAQIIKLTNSSFGGASEALWSPDSKQLAFRAELDLAGCIGLYAYNIANANKFILSTPCDATYKDAYTFVWSPDSSKIAFGNVTINSRLDLYISNSDGSNKIHLITAAANWNGVVPGYRENSILITPDNNHVLFQAELSGVAVANAASMKFNFYSIKADGSGSPVMLHSVPTNTGIRDFPLVSLSPDGSRVVFSGDLEKDTVYELYMSSVDGGNQRKLSPTITNSLGAVYSGAQQYFFDWNHDIAGYISDTTIDGVGALYLNSVTTTASAPLQINLPQNLTGDFNQLVRSANGQTIIFRANPDVDAEMHLYACNGDGTNMHRVSKSFVAGGGLMRTYAVSNDGQKIAYTSDQDAAGKPELYIADASGGAPVKISTAIVVAGGSVVDFVFDDAHGKIFYRAYVNSTTHAELYSVNYDGTSTTQVTPAYLAAGNISSWSLSPDGSYLAARGDFFSDELYEVVTVPSAGGALTRINPTGNVASGFKISPDSTWICSWGPFTSSPVEARVYNVNTTTRYTMVAGVSATQGAAGCEFTPDSAHVVVSGDWLTDGKTMLKSFKLADQTLTTLSGSLAAIANTSWFSHIDSGAIKRVITLSETSPEIYEIYSQNYDGTDFKKISQAPYSGGQVNANQNQAVRILDDANHSIIYSGLIDRLGHWDLYSVRWDGSANQKIISLNSYADIYDFNVVPGSDKLLFRADNDKDSVLNLYTVKADGSNLKNHTPGMAFATSASDNYTLTASQVIFKSDAYRNQVFEIFADPL